MDRSTAAVEDWTAPPASPCGLSLVAKLDVDDVDLIQLDATPARPGPAQSTFRLMTQ